MENTLKLRGLIVALTIMATIALAPAAKASVTMSNSDGMAFRVNTSASNVFQGAIKEAAFAFHVTRTNNYPDISWWYSSGRYGIHYPSSYAAIRTSGSYLWTFSSPAIRTTNAINYGTTYYTSPVTSAFFTDSYDDAYRLFIDVAGGSGSTGFTGNAVSTEEAGREFVMGPQTIDGLEVTRKVYVPAGERWVRHLIIINNPTGSAITTDIDIVNDLGSDSNTANYATQSGDKIATTGDRWVVTTQINRCCDPHLYHNIDGPGGADSLDAISFILRNGNPSWSWNSVTINPGETAVYGFFNGGRTTVADAVTTANAIDATPNSIAAGMTKAEITNTRNWSINAGGGRRRVEIPYNESNNGNNGPKCTISAGSDSQADTSTILAAMLMLLPIMWAALGRRRVRVHIKRN